MTVNHVYLCKIDFYYYSYFFMIFIIYHFKVLVWQQFLFSLMDKDEIHDNLLIKDFVQS